MFIFVRWQQVLFKKQPAAGATPGWLLVITVPAILIVLTMTEVLRHTSGSFVKILFAKSEP